MSVSKAIPPFDTILQAPKDYRYRLFENCDYPIDHIPENKAFFVFDKLGIYHVVMTSVGTYIRLHKNHLWRYCDREHEYRRTGFPTNTIGIANDIRYLPIMTPAISGMVKGLDLENRDIMEIFGNDFLHSIGRPAQPNWLFISYKVIADPRHCSTPIIKLSKAYRHIDALIAVLAARNNSASPEILAMADMAPYIARWKAEIGALIEATSPKPEIRVYITATPTKQQQNPNRCHHN